MLPRPIKMYVVYGHDYGVMGNGLKMCCFPSGNFDVNDAFCIS